MEQTNVSGGRLEWWKMKIVVSWGRCCMRERVSKRSQSKFDGYACVEGVIGGWNVYNQRECRIISPRFESELSG